MTTNVFRSCPLLQTLPFFSRVKDYLQLEPYFFEVLIVSDLLFGIHIYSKSLGMRYL